MVNHLPLKEALDFFSTPPPKCSAFETSLESRNKNSNISQKLDRCALYKSNPWW